MSQEALARKAGCALATVQRVEHGETRHPTLDVARRIAAALGCTVDDLWPPETTGADAR